MLAQGNLPRRYWVHWQEVHWIFHIFLGGKFIPYGMLNLKSLISVFGLYIFKLHNEPCCVGIAGAVGWISHHKWAQLDASGCEHTMLSWMIWVEICKDAGRQGPLPFSIFQKHPRKHWCGMPKWWLAEVWKLLFQRWDFGDVGTFRDDCKWWRVWLTLRVPHDPLCRSSLVASGRHWTCQRDPPLDSKHAGQQKQRVERFLKFRVELLLWFAWHVSETDTTAVYQYWKPDEPCFISSFATQFVCKLYLIAKK